MNFPQVYTLPSMYKFNDSGCSCLNKFWILLAAAVPIIAAISKARAGLLSTFIPMYFAPAFAAFPIYLKKSPNPSAFIVRSDTTRLLFLLHVVQVPRDNFMGNPVFIDCNISKNICGSGIKFSTNTIRNIFKFIIALLNIINPDNLNCKC